MPNSNIHQIIRILERETRQWAQPVTERYLHQPFLVLISCLLSLRTKDATTDAAGKRLFERGRSPEEILKLPAAVIEKLIYPVGFYRTKAKNIKTICRLLLDNYQGRVPDEIEELLKLPGVGRKTANLVVTLGYGKPGICVDIHVHRITNRLGYAETKTPEETEMALRAKLPPPYWLKINNLLVTYGQNLCTPVSPFCTRCKIKRYCRRVGVTSYR